MDTPRFLVPKVLSATSVLARMSLYKEGAFYRAKHRPRSEKLGPGACKLAPLGRTSGAVLKVHHVWLQVCDGDSREDLTSHFPFGLLSFGSLQLEISDEPAHALCLDGLGAQGGLSSVQEPFSPIFASQSPSLG